MSGHSLGGVVASNYSIKNNSKIDYLILFASYPTKKINNIKLLSIYGENDKVLNQKSYKDSKKYWPDDSKEVIIKGGNHAQFGNYGKQKGDGESTISNEEQQNQTIEEIIKFLNNQ